MLIIAIPKSASSSLLETLGKLHPQIKTIQDFSFGDNKIPFESRKIHFVHSDIRELSRKEVEKFKDEKVIFKQHIFPSENNIQLLQNIKKVILLRKPEEILLAYKRGAIKNHNSLPPGYSKKMNEKDLLSTSKEDGFMEDIQFFYDSWYNARLESNILVINYHEYLKFPNDTINKIERFFELPLTLKKVIPVKARYSKLKTTDHLKALRKRIRSILMSGLTILGLKSVFKNLKNRFS